MQDRPDLQKHNRQLRGKQGGAAILRIYLLTYPMKVQRESRGVYSAGLLRSRPTSCVRARNTCIRAIRAIRAWHSGLTRQMCLTIIVFWLVGIAGIVGQVGIVALQSIVRLTRHGRQWR